jgi:hypothetical protein
VERYHFFPASIRQWHPNAKSLLDQGRDESSSDGTLATCQRVLKQVGGREGRVLFGWRTGKEGKGGGGSEKEVHAELTGLACSPRPALSPPLDSCLRQCQVHDDFFSEQAPSPDASQPPLSERDVRRYLGQQRESILQGCHLVFR